MSLGFKKLMLLLSFFIGLCNDLRPLIRLCGVGDHLMSVEHWLSAHRRGKPEYSNKILPLFHFIHPKYQIHWPGIKTGPVR